MQTVKSWVIGAAIALALGSAACNTTGPTPPPPPPPPPPGPVLSCGEGVSRSTVNAGGMTVSFDTPAATGGQGTVSVTCSPASGENFPIGTTAVTCKATDTLNRTA